MINTDCCSELSARCVLWIGNGVDIFNSAPIPELELDEELSTESHFFSRQ